MNGGGSAWLYFKCGLECIACGAGCVGSAKWVVECSMGLSWLQPTVVGAARMGCRSYYKGEERVECSKGELWICCSDRYWSPVGLPRGVAGCCLRPGKRSELGWGDVLMAVVGAAV